MAEKKTKPELPQPRTDVILPSGGDFAEFDAHPPLRTPSPGRQESQQVVQGVFQEPPLPEQSLDVG